MSNELFHRTIFGKNSLSYTKNGYLPHSVTTHPAKVAAIPIPKTILVVFRKAVPNLFLLICQSPQILQSSIKMPSPTIMRKAKNTTYTLGHFVLKKSFSPEIVFCPRSLEHKFGIPIVYSISIFSIFGIPKTIKGTLVFVSKMPSIAANFAGWYFAVLCPCICVLGAFAKKLQKKQTKSFGVECLFLPFFFFLLAKSGHIYLLQKKQKRVKMQQQSGRIWPYKMEKK